VAGSCSRTFRTKASTSTNISALQGRATTSERQQSARAWELHATTSLARLLRDTNRRDEARAMLAEIYNWFTEGFDTADVRDAKALLDAVKSVAIQMSIFDCVREISATGLEQGNAGR